jgi:HEAT repeat protein
MPLLLSLLASTNEYAAMSAALALGRITNRCDEAIPSLHKMLNSTNDYYRAVASMTLWRLGGNAEETRQTLEKLLTSKGGRGVAAEYLGEMGPAARASVPALLKASQQPMVGAWVDMHARAECAKAILLIQGGTTEAYAVLEESITTEKNSWVRQTMTAEIAELGPLAQPLVPVLHKALNDPKREVRHEAMLALELLEKRNKKHF